MDAFQEQFDFSLLSKVYISPDGKVVFVAEIGQVEFGDWRCFIDTFLDRYNVSWKGLIAEIVAKYIIGLILRDIVEGKITDAMGSMSLDIFDFRRVPIVGDYLAWLADNTPDQVVAKTYPDGEGLEIFVGRDG
jgi:hypothetical protein